MTAAVTERLKAWLSDSGNLKKLLQWGIIGALCLCVLILGLSLKPHAYQSPDEKNYIAMAQRMLEGQPYGYWSSKPDAYVSPGMPLFLVAGMAVFGTDMEGIACIKAVQCVLFALTVLLTYILGRQLTGRFGVGLMASLLVATNGLFYIYIRHLLTETLYFFTMMLFFVVFVRAVKMGRLWLHLIGGICFAVTVMVRPLVIIVAPFIYLPLVAARWRKWREILLPVLCFAIGFVAVCLPWWIRNYVVLGKVVLFATQTNPMFAGLMPDISVLGIKNPGSIMGNLKLLFRLLREDFFGTVYWMTFGKFRIIFMGNMENAQPQILSIVSRDVTVYLGLFGGIRALLSKKGWGPALAFWVYFASTFMFVPTERYSLQYIPLLAIFAGYFTVKAFDGWRGSSWLPRGKEAIAPEEKSQKSP